jgi:hypothetical protein
MRTRTSFRILEVGFKADASQDILSRETGVEIVLANMQQRRSNHVYHRSNNRHTSCAISGCRSDLSNLMHDQRGPGAPQKEAGSRTDLRLRYKMDFAVSTIATCFQQLGRQPWH